MVEALTGEHTQHEIGQLFGLTRMRICQLEKRIYNKIRLEC
jgi:DNA-directed RNA polymerase specialized sigma subunit